VQTPRIMRDRPRSVLSGPGAHRPPPSMHPLDFEAEAANARPEPRASYLHLPSPPGTRSRRFEWPEASQPPRSGPSSTEVLRDSLSGCLRY